MLTNPTRASPVYPERKLIHVRVRVGSGDYSNLRKFGGNPEDINYTPFAKRFLGLSVFHGRAANSRNINGAVCPRLPAH